MVSVIVPVYNGEKYLKEMLDSVRGQTLKELEVLCINDGSEDRSFCCRIALASTSSTMLKR